MATEPVHGRAFQFVTQLAESLRSEDLELPAFPDVVARIQATLADENATVKQVVNVIGSEPVLTARLLRMANSAALNPGGKPVSNINSAVTRLGFNLVRGTAAAYAIGQMRQVDELEPIRPELEKIWKASNEVAAICYVIAKRVFGRQPDEAMLAGLLHQIGRLYILTHTLRVEPELTDDPDYAAVLQGWQASIGGTILHAWGLPERIAEAVTSQDDLLEGDDADLSPLAKLLAAAKLRNRIASEPTLRELYPDADERMHCLTFGSKSFLDLVASGQSDIETMQQTLAA